MLESKKRIIELRDTYIEYLLTGEENQDTILFLHGLGADLSQFERQHLFFENRYRVLSINLRGHGASRPIGKYSPQKFHLCKLAMDIIKVLDKLDIDYVHIVGNSMGGNIGYELLKARPDIIRTLVTFGTTAKLYTSCFILFLTDLVYRLLGMDILARISQWSARKGYARMKIVQMLSRADLAAILCILPNLADIDYLDIIGSTSTPCMIIKCDKDKAVNNNIGSTISKFQKRGSFHLHEMQEVGHFANLDNPFLFNKVLDDYLKER
jgi:pimeloyl-ACP methyl ester carboxylesterase